MTQVEATAAGLRAFCEDLARKESERVAAVGAVARPKLDFEVQLSEEALPVPWGAAAVDGARMRERWSYEIRELKRMGFEDESVILRALKEAAGNLQRAVKLLRRMGAVSAGAARGD
jgi:translation elongation factor EF-Ts